MDNLGNSFMILSIRDRLINKGWMQRSFGSSTSGPNCAVGAARAVGIDIESRYDLLKLIFDTDNPLAFNDDHDTTYADIIGLLDQAAVMGLPWSLE